MTKKEFKNIINNVIHFSKNNYIYNIVNTDIKTGYLSVFNEIKKYYIINGCYNVLIYDKCFDYVKALKKLLKVR